MFPAAQRVPCSAPGAAQQRRALRRLEESERRGRTEAGGGSSLAGVGSAFGLRRPRVCTPRPFRALTGAPEVQGAWHPEPPARAPGAGLEGRGRGEGPGGREACLAVGAGQGLAKPS